jgi:hypothetical protein
MMLGRVLQLVMLAMVAMMMTGGVYARPKMDAPKGYALLIGVDQLDSKAWGGWRGQLQNCHNDVDAMNRMLVAQGFAAEQLLDSKATTAMVREGLQRIGRTCNAGDTFVIYFSGYGSQLLDGNKDEDDRLDDTWCLYDGHLLDDHLMNALAEIRAGVRIVVLADCSHSATSVRLAAEDYESLERASAKMKTEAQVVVELDQEEQRLTEKDMLNAFQDFRLGRTTRGLTVGQAINAYHNRRGHYDNLAANAPTREQQQIAAGLLFISACQPIETAAEGDTHGLFTQLLLDIWDNGQFKGGYDAFLGQISTRTNDKRQSMSQGRFTQQPMKRVVGAGAELDNQQPFTVVPRQQSDPIDR